jgi:hypothetical protein
MRPRPKPVVKELRPGLYELWFGQWVLLAGTDRERLEELAALMA